MMRKLKNILNSLQGKILIFFILSIFFIAAVTWQCQTHLLFVSVADDETEYMNNLAGQIATAVEEDQKSCENFLIQLSYNRNISEILSQTYDDYNLVWEGTDEISYLFKQQIAMVPGILRIQVHHTNQTFCEDGKYIFLTSDKPTHLNQYISWHEAENGVYEIGREMEGMYNDRMAYMRFAIDMEYVFGRYLDDSSEFKGRYFILDEDYEYIAGSGESQLPELDAWEYELLKNGEAFRDKEQQTILTCVHAGGSWYVLVEYPIAEYNSNKLHAGTVVFIVLLLYCLIAGGLLVLFMDRIFARLNKIGSNLEEIGKKDFRFLNHLRGHDEISRLEKQYNGMVEKLSDTIAEMSEMQNKKQQLEIRVLESQINPHFLYNTLGVMQWKALETGDRELCKMIENMTVFYRLSMSKGLGLIPVEKEVEQIEAYIAIQQIRYDYCVDYRIEMATDAKGILIPKMILQPLVENIYLHAGIVLEGRQKIRIKIISDEEFLYIHVCDNGSGMDEETLHNLNHNINLSEERGIGISFIYSSLDMYYSKRASLHFQSSMGNGTTAKIKIPIMPMEV